MRSLSTKNIKVTLLRSHSGRSETQKRTLISLGLKRIGESRVLPNLNPILGQVNKVIQWVKVEPAE
ncbi:50S ribosomal protein L30 [bacterium]|nr:50S ribosomal protein L30 [bacterium]